MDTNISACQNIWETYARAAAQLDAAESDRDNDLRKQNRMSLHARASVTTFEDSYGACGPYDGFLRNVSATGVALLLEKELLRGQPLEIAVLVDGQPKRYLAGIVAFCREATNSIHEIGVQVFDQGTEPILTRDPDAPLRSLMWVSQLL